MAAAAGIAAAAAIAAAATAEGASAGSTLDVTYANQKFQRRVNRLNTLMQMMQWQREDTAVQRRVKDLRAAGLSPTLAAGSAAQSGMSTHIDPLEQQGSKIDFGKTSKSVLEAVPALIEAYQLKNEVAKNKWLEVQASRANEVIDKKLKNLDSSSSKNFVSAADLLHNLKIGENTGISTKDTSQVGKMIKDIGGPLFTNFSNTLKVMEQIEKNKRKVKK